jgi:hypothetical protein
MPYRVTAVEPTPNPNAVKFMLDQDISAGSESFLDSTAGADHPLAKELFAIEGVVSLLFLGNFVTVNKTPDVAWKRITPKVKKVLAAAS